MLTQLELNGAVMSPDWRYSRLQLSCNSSGHNLLRWLTTRITPKESFIVQWPVL